ncbi:MerR family transcriptional regulator [Nocardioides sp. W3-2-3]|nr:MerR family transcriptional regulator [Nocardioides convexus]
MRTVRFYTSRNLVPPPIRRGRSGYYSAVHVARIEPGPGACRATGSRCRPSSGTSPGSPPTPRPRRSRWPGRCSRPGSPTCPSRWTAPSLERTAGRALSGEDLATLQALGVLRVRGSSYLVAANQTHHRHPVARARLPARGRGRRGIGLPGARRADGQGDSPRWCTTKLAPLYDDAGASEHFREIMERLKPLSVGGLVSAYEAAVARAARNPRATR